MPARQKYTLKGRVDDIDSLVSKRLKRCRVLLGYNQAELGKAVNVSIQQIQKYEKAVNRISSGKLYNFAKFLNVPINYFFEFKEEPGKNIQDIADKTFTNEKELLSLVKVLRV